MKKITPMSPRVCNGCNRSFTSHYAFKRHICQGTETGQAAKRAVRALAVVSILGLLGACSAPSPVVAGCFLPYVAPPVTPWGQADNRIPDGHCLLTLPDDIVRGGTIEVAPNAWTEAAR